jgi:ribonuclease BN (tRNA processing enzyme)
MRLTTVGTGTAAPAPGRVQAGHLVDAGDVHLLLDCGSGVAGRMADLGLHWQGITHVALSHFHADHTVDLATLIYAWRYGDLPPRTAPLTVIGPAGTGELVQRLAAAFGAKLLAPDYPVSIHEIAPGESLDLGGATLSAIEVPHTDESVAYSVVEGPRRLVYTGDTGWDEALGHWAGGADVLLCECSLPAELAIPSHLTPEQCGALAAIAAPRLLALTHFYPPVEQVDIAGLVAERFGGQVALARDGWRIQLEDL